MVCATLAWNALSTLLDKRLIVVTGKGGTGKTTVAAALGLLAARAGKRTIVAEVSEQERLSALFGRRALGHREGKLADGLHGISIDPRRAKEEWLRYQLHSSALAGLLGGSRIFQYLTAAAPGVDELVTIGKVWDLAQLERRVGGTRAYDLAIVDSPATGHGLALLRAPRTYASIARVGPIAKQANIIHEFVTNPHCTGVVAVALPEEMPVNETIDLRAGLREDMGMEIDVTVVNGVLPDRFEAPEAERLAALDGRVSDSTRAAVTTALSEHGRAGDQREEIERLRREGGEPLITLPFLFEPDLGPRELEQLARRLEEEL
jgi:anion-transporting  ArsA/GET3 family ATPase